MKSLLNLQDANLMIAIRPYLLIPIFLSIWTLPLLSQGDTAPELINFKPPLKRQLFHDYIDKEQKYILTSDGKADDQLIISSNDEINFYVTNSVLKKVDWLQFKIEKDSLIGDQQKVGYLRGLEKLLKNINGNLRSRTNSASIPAIIEAYEIAMMRDKSGQSIDAVVAKASYETGNAVVRSGAFDRNPGFKTSKEILLRKYFTLYPDRVFITLKDDPNVPFLDSIVKVAAYKYPNQLYDYASANNRLAFAIRKIDDPMVKAISKMATSRGSGQLYFPFLDNILKGKMSFEEIDAIKDDSIKYYKLLVKTKLDYVERAFNKDTAYAFRVLNSKLEQKARDVFVNVINGLHELDDPIRFRIIQQLSAEELYYLTVLSDGIIYTSSYVKGVYPLMMNKIGQRGDSLLMAVKFDKYRKFIKMAAGYNTLSNFLNSFHNPDYAEKLMQAFVGGLEKTPGLEDGVDVADSYASIAETIKPLANEMLQNVKLNYEKNTDQNNKRGMVIYNLLYKLFLSADSTKSIDLSKELGIPPVYGVNYKALSNDTSGVVMQVFFYGDKDGQNIFQGFLRQFGNSSWKIIPSDKWVTISSAKGKPVLIFANRPLPEETGEDEKAQHALNEYLAKRNLRPTVVIHRGHSYYAPYTISQILSSAKIVFMGSCGGYHLVHDILANAPDAHIIASKQIGKTRINQPFFNLLMEKARNGNDINWIPFWQELNKMVKVEGFEDYIPPHKNLGAIFIKAYKIAMGDSSEE